MSSIYEKLNFPDKYLIDSKINKSDIFDVADLLSNDKKLIQNSIEKITVKYSFNPSTINIQPYISDERDYYEIEIVEVLLRENSKFKRIAEILMRTIPYPLLLIFIYKNNVLLATGDMRKNLSDSSKVTVEDFVYTDWININTSNEYIDKLFSGLNVSTLNTTNYYLMYKDITTKLNLYNISKVKGENISDSVNMSNSDIRNYYNRINDIDEQIKSIEKQLNKNSSVSDRVDASLQIKQLKAERENILKHI